MCPTLQQAKIQSMSIWSKESFINQESANGEDGSPSGVSNPF